MVKSVMAGRIHRAAGARAHDRGDLRDDARGERVPQEDVGVAAEREHAFLDARAARIVQPDDRRAQLHREIHDLHDLRGVGFRQRSAEHGEVLREREDLPAVDEAVAGDDAVTGNDLVRHAEIAAAVGDELVDLLERAGIEQQIDPLAGGQLAGGVLALEAIGAAAELGAPLEIVEESRGIHRSQPRAAAVSERYAVLSQRFTACAFSQSFRNFSRPMLVSGWLNN